MKELKVSVEFGLLLDKGAWPEFCDKYGVNIWCMNEGLADRETTYMITLDDAIKWELNNETPNS